METATLHPHTWPLSRLPEALEALAQRSGLQPRPNTLTEPPPTLTPTSLNRWLETAAATLGLETTEAAIGYASLPAFLQTASPALCLLPSGDSTTSDMRFLALSGRRGNTLHLLTPSHTEVSVPLAAVHAALGRELEAPLLPEIDRILREAAVAESRLNKARQTLLNERLGEHPVTGCWLLDLAPNVSFWRQLRHAGIPQRLAAFVAAHAVQYLLLLLAWWLIGRAVFEGEAVRGWLIAWALLLITMVPLRLIVVWLQGVMAVTIGGLLQKVLLYGALRLQPDDIRDQGSGQLLGRVFESEAMESLAINGGLLSVMAAVELLFALWVTGQGAGGGWHVLQLLGWLALMLSLAFRFYRSRQRWTDGRRTLTNALIERMVGHRTRLAQQDPARWHDGEDALLAHYVAQAADMDGKGIPLISYIGRGWIALGLLGLIPAFLAGGASAARLAIGLGGVVAAHLALRKLAQGLTHLLSASIAWEQIAPMFAAAQREESLGDAAVVAAERSPSSDGTLIAAHDLVYRYGRRETAVLNRANLTVKTGDRLLLTGSSGGGKSTLAALLTGLRDPDGGLLLLHGLDKHTLGGSGWRRIVAAAPQFHENHVLTATFAFNLLLGRQWPPREADMAAAYEVCAAVGLDRLLETMPAGMLQLVGETGWQLSHGEKSRLYMARALLQNADLIILDESFAALDPYSLRQAMTAVRERAKTLLVIAHP